MAISQEKSSIRSYEVTVLSLPIVYSFNGDYDPNGLMYILSKDKEYVRKKAMDNFYNKDENGDPLPIPTDEVQPLTLRANVGEIVEIKFHHNEDRRLSIHMQGLKYESINSDGAYVGYNTDSTVGANEVITYRWKAEKDGIYYFSDMGDTRASQKGTNIHGLFGALIVQEKGSTWTNPVDGRKLESGLFADIHNPYKESFREYAVYFHDELETVNRFGLPLISPHTNQPMGMTAISYRSEPMANRAHFIPEKDKGCKYCNPNSPKQRYGHIDTKQHEEHMLIDGEDVSMSSWVYGDPSTFIPRAYKGDPTKFRLIHGGVLETHVFHLHTHQWRLEPNNPNSKIIDSQSVGPQESFTIDIIDGAGSLPGSIGDNIWHCHLYPHFDEGMWSLWRIFDRLETGKDVIDESGAIIKPLYPDGSYMKELKPLPDRIAPPNKTLEHPGYPSFINGTYKERAPQPPLGVLNQNGQNKLCPTALEKNNFTKNYTKGALYCQPCEDSIKKCKCSKPDVVFELFVLEARIEYNRSGWYDPHGRFYVTKEQIEDYTGCDLTIENRECLAKRYVRGVENGCVDVEPLMIRANAGDCIEVRLTNFLPEIIPGSDFQLATLTDNVGFHIHLVKFDVIVSDGGANGYNNSSSVFYGETLVERYYADEELQACFFHDHMNPNSHQQHGMFAVLIIEPEGSKYYNPTTGRPLRYGTKAVIKTPSGRVFREFGLFVHDFALLFDRDKKPLNKPPFPGSHDDPGVMGINYKCEPLGERLNIGDDPAYVFSSKIYGDPVTPILEAYPGEEIVIRLIDGAQEEQHGFNINGMKWRREINDENSPLVQAQSLGISEVFNIRIEDNDQAGDYMYYFGGQDDLWLGLWGIIRIHGNTKRCLKPINNDYKYPNQNNIFDYDSANIKEFHIAAIQKNLEYNSFKDHDPYGLLFVPYEYKDKIISGDIDPRPLILRVNKGDYIKVTLTNCFDKPIPYLDFPGVPVDKEITPSMRVGISPQLLDFNPITSSGVNIGYNDIEQTVGPGQSITYMWHADKEYGTCLLTSLTDIRNQRYHGLFGAIIVEPEGASIISGNGYDVYKEQATIKVDNNNQFREFVLFMQNGIRLVDIEGNLIETNNVVEEGEEAEAVDFEDRGEKGFNYKSERFFNRLEEDEDISKVFSSLIHRDPSTPILEAYSGEKVIIRLLMPADKPRNTCFVLHGHQWKAQNDDPLSNIISAQGAIGVGNVYNIELLGGASLIPGDYLYRSGLIRWDIESGMWGIMRIKEKSKSKENNN